MKNPKAIAEAVLQCFDQEPTAGQSRLTVMLAEFICSDQENAAFVLRGYAGTGKTSLISALVRILPQFRLGSVLLAPTGRAAKVLAGYSGRQASTIHRKIYRVFASGEGSVTMSLQKNPHRHTLFIVDEASMISDESAGERDLFARARLLEDLLRYVASGEDCRLILIGDAAQLPPIGTDESPALDLTYLKASYQLSISSLELTEVVRQARESGILSNATYIREKIRKNDPALPFFPAGSWDDLRSINGMELEDALHTAYSAGEREDTLVITRSNKRANIFNTEIRNRILGYDGELNAGDLVMCVRNNYFWMPPDSFAGFIANGDIMEVLRVRKTFDMYGFRFADVQVRLIDYPEEKDVDLRILLDTLSSDGPSLTWTDHKRLYDEIMKDYENVPSKVERNRSVRNHPCFNAVQVKFSYALTCHKAQGGQWKHVFIEQGYLTEQMIDRGYLRWLYTAMTRATGKLYLVNFTEKFFG